MIRPVRPVALVILTACMLYPGVTMLYQGLYPFCTGEWFALVSQHGVWMDLAQRFGIPMVAVSVAQTLVGLAWVAGVPGLWAGDQRAYPLVVLAAIGSLLSPGGPMVMSILALICLFGFREKPEEVTA